MVSHRQDLAIVNARNIVPSTPDGTYGFTVGQRKRPDLDRPTILVSDSGYTEIWYDWYGMVDWLTLDVGCGKQAGAPAYTARRGSCRVLRGL